MDDYRHNPAAALELPKADLHSNMDDYRPAAIFFAVHQSGNIYIPIWTIIDRPRGSAAPSAF